MSFQDFTHLSVQHGYEVRKAGFGRLAVIIDEIGAPVSTPRLVLGGDDAVLVHDARNAVVLPEFPQQYISELLQAGNILIGEKRPMADGGRTELVTGSRAPVRRFYEASVSINREETEALRMAGIYAAASTKNLGNQPVQA